MISVKRFGDVGEIKKVNVGLVGFFQSYFYLKSFSDSFCDEDDLVVLGVWDDKEVVGYGVFEKVEDGVVLLGMKKVLGGEEVSDYGDVVIEGDERVWRAGWERILEWFRGNGFCEVVINNLREDSVSYQVFKGGVVGMEIDLDVCELAPYIDLQKNWDNYLNFLERKKRKEIRRKIRRLEEVNSFSSCSEKTARSDFEEFILLHRLSDTNKKKFMTERMKEFFWKLIEVEKPEWEVSICFLSVEGKRVASLLSFENETEILLYNSGYDPKYDYYSVGFLLVAFKIKRAIEEGKKVFDFMRGEERYKYDLGGKDKKLYRVEIRL